MGVEYKKQTLVPMIVLAAACLAAGILGSASWFAFTSQARGAFIARQVSTSLARVQLLESILRRQAEVSVSLATGTGTGDAPAAEPVAPRPAAAVTPAAAAVRKERMDRALAVAGQAPSRAAPPSAAAPPVAAVTPDRQADATGGRQKLVVGSSVSADALNLARASNKIEGLDSTQLGTKLGVAKLETTGVVMRAGSKIPIGGKFPSGERLLAVDPVEGQITTDQRTIMVF